MCCWIQQGLGKKYPELEEHPIKDYLKSFKVLLARFLGIALVDNGILESQATVRFLHSILKTGPKMDSGKEPSADLFD